MIWFAKERFSGETCFRGDTTYRSKTWGSFSRSSPIAVAACGRAAGSKKDGFVFRVALAAGGSAAGGGKRRFFSRRHGSTLSESRQALAAGGRAAGWGEKDVFFFRLDGSALSESPLALAAGGRAARSGVGREPGPEPDAVTAHGP